VGVFVAMMPTPERVARALCRAHGGDPDFVTQAKRGTDSQTGLPYIIPSFPQWKRYEVDAIAAIEALREPGLAIREITNFEFAEIEWPKLIDAALSESRIKSARIERPKRAPTENKPAE
jgi:hypothetical protein